MSNYSYQIKAANQVLTNALNPSFEASVLAATPGSGKTTISHMIIEKYLKMMPNARVLVLTHGQNLLRDQYLNDLSNPNTEISFSFGALDSDYQVKVGIPQSIKLLKESKIDLLVVDECHEFYLAPLVQKIITKLTPKHQILMTGSPSEFNILNYQGRKFAMCFISYEDIVSQGVFSGVEIGVSETEELKIGGKINDMIKWARVNRKNLSKIVIAVKTIKEAVEAKQHLERIGRKVAVSTSENDSSNSEIPRFKAGECNTLVIVNRGVLGFSDTQITGIFDLKCSPDLDVSVQLFARVLRKHTLGIKKFYYRVSNKKDYNKQAKMCVAIKGFMDSNIFKNYNGTNLVVDI